MEMQQFYYDNKIVKKIHLCHHTVGSGWNVGRSYYWHSCFYSLTCNRWHISWLSFGRLRPLHTNAVIFAFVGNAIFAGVYYSLSAPA
jgi:cytochrome c oxidase cbb3-type subunit I/II